MRLRRSKPAIRIEIWRAASDAYWFHIVDAQNGQILAQSQGYSRGVDATSTARKITPAGTPIVWIGHIPTPQPPGVNP